MAAIFFPRVGIPIALAILQRGRRSRLPRTNSLAIAARLIATSRFSPVARAIAAIRFALVPASGGGSAGQTTITAQRMRRLKSPIATFQQANSRTKTPGDVLI